jgi:metal transporter CNNM
MPFEAKRVTIPMPSGNRQATTRPSSNGYTTGRTAVVGLAKVLFLGLSQASLAGAAPLKRLLHLNEHDDGHVDGDDPEMWVYLGIAVVLVLLGGVFAGLTIA